MRAIFRIAIVRFLPFPLKYGAESASPKAPLALHKGARLCYTPRQSTGGIWSPDVFLRFQPGRWMDRPTTEIGAESTVQVLVRDNNVDQALRALKKKMQREGIFREMKMRRNYEKPSERKAREKAEAVRRHRKLLRKRLEREGY
jgi:small subunit ribosomal protein S21